MEMQVKNIYPLDLSKADKSKKGIMADIYYDSKLIAKFLDLADGTGGGFVRFMSPAHESKKTFLTLAKGTNPDTFAQQLVDKAIKSNAAAEPMEIVETNASLKVVCGGKTIYKLAKTPMVYVASPLGASTDEEMEANKKAAKRYVNIVKAYLKADASVRTMPEFAFLKGVTAYAPHAKGELADVLDDNIPAHRQIALDFGQRVLANSAAVCVCGTRVSKGMKAEIASAKKSGIPVINLKLEKPTSSGK